jgi:threonine/homoserine/homoserine lactone efflux protein
MFDPTTLYRYLLIAAVLTVTPGADTLYVLARSLQHGRRAGVVSALGIISGMMVHLTAAIVGLSALLLASAVAFTAVKLVGAAYLVYLGLRTLLARAAPPDLSAPVAMPPARLYAQGFVTNVLNPKVALFFIAFLPQFVDPARGAVPAQIGALGAMDMALGLVWLSVVAALVGAARHLIAQSRTFWRVQKWVTGSILMGLGVRLLAASRE